LLNLHDWYQFGDVLADVATLNGEEVESKKYIKMLCAASGISAFVLMVVLTVAQDLERTDTAYPVPTPNINIGQTSTAVTVPASVAITNVAQPTLKAQRPNGF
jgi:hypothetical protein